MTEMKLTPEAQQILIEMQASQQQIQAVLMQKESLNLQNVEMDKALEEMKKTKEKEVFKIVGPVLIKAEDRLRLAYLFLVPLSSSRTIRQV